MRGYPEDRGPTALAWALITLVAVSVVGSIVLLPNHEQHPAPLPEQPAPAPPHPAPPPCVHEDCHERPVRMRCARVGHQAAYCDVYTLDYERYCVCDRWGP
jgi:hypothetical protein